MWMVLVSLTETQDSTSGHLLQLAGWMQYAILVVMSLDQQVLVVISFVTQVILCPGTFHSDNPLWDGDGCVADNECCPTDNPPYFHKTLPQPTTDDIEMRVCRNEGRSNEDIAIETVEIYVQ